MSDQPIQILVIEDNEADYFILKTYFSKIEKGFYEITWSDTTEKALETLDEKEFDLCLLDYSINSTETGIEFAKRAKLKDRLIPCILLTGYDDIDPESEGADGSIYDYLLKEELNPSLLNRSIIYALQRKNAEQNLVKAKQYTSHIVNSVPMMILQTNSDGKITQANPAATFISGFDESELVGKKLLDLISEDDLEKAKEYAKAPSGGSGNIRMATKSGEEKLIAWNTIPSEQEDVIVIGKDITLETLEQENEKQRQKMEALGQLAGGVSHEVNNLLQPILLLGEISKDEVDTDPKAVKESLEIIVDNAQAAAVIVKDILAFARQEQEGDNDENVPFVDILTDSIKFSQDLLPKTIQIDTLIGDNMSDIRSSLIRTDMIKIFSNLLINASLAMNKKGEIRIETERKEIEKKKADSLKIHSGDYAIIRVKDNGCGIPKDVIDNIFNPFFTTREVGSGTGLGLSIVYTIIQNVGGTITVNSKVDKGTTFHIFIPINQ